MEKSHGGYFLDWGGSEEEGNCLPPPHEYGLAKGSDAPAWPAPGQPPSPDSDSPA